MDTSTLILKILTQIIEPGKAGVRIVFANWESQGPEGLRNFSQGCTIRTGLQLASESGFLDLYYLPIPFAHWTAPPWICLLHHNYWFFFFLTTWMSWSLKISLILGQGPTMNLQACHRSFHQALPDSDPCVIITDKDFPEVIKMQVNVGNPTQMKL